MRPATDFGKNLSLHVIKVPLFVAEKWNAATPGTTVAVLSDNTIHLPKSARLPVTKVQCKGPPETHGQHIAISSPSLTTKEGLSITGAQIEGAIIETRAFLPDVMDPKYRAWVAKTAPPVKRDIPSTAKTPVVLSVEQTAALHHRLVDDTSAEESRKRLFHYVDSEAPTSANTPLGEDRPAAKRRAPAAPSDDVQAKLFRFLEEKGSEGASFKDVTQHLGVSQTIAKQLLDAVAEQKRERSSKRVLFVLRAEYR